MGNISYNKTLHKFEYASKKVYLENGENRLYPYAIPYESTNNYHERIIEIDGVVYPCFFFPEDKRGHVQHFYKKKDYNINIGHGGGLSVIHEACVDILREKYTKITIRLNGIYECEYDSVCPYKQESCKLKLKPEFESLKLDYYDEMYPPKTKSKLYPTREPDVLLRNSRTAEELWLEVHYRNEQTNDPDRILLGVPIVEFDVSDEQDLYNIQKWNIFSTDHISKFDGKPYTKSNKFRVFNPWNFPNFRGANISCQQYLNSYDLRPKYIQTGVKKNHFFVLPTGERIHGEIGSYGQFLPTTPEGRWYSRRNLPAGFTEEDQEEAVFEWKVQVPEDITDLR